MSAVRSAAAWGERHQVVLYVMAIVCGAVVGWVVPGSQHAEVAIEPVLGVLLYATFLAVPFQRLGASLRDTRFLVSVAVLNFVAVPAVVWLLVSVVGFNDAVLIGVLFVLLTPCIDYVIVFAGGAGGAADRLLAAAPLLMFVQMLALPLYLLIFIGPDAGELISVGPFVRAFVLLIVLPLAAAVVTQMVAARRAGARRLMMIMQELMVPLMCVTLAVVVASQIAGVGQNAAALVGVVPIFIGFVVVMVGVGIVLARWARLDVPGSRALVFSGVTRNSLVVLPLALALPPALSLASLVVVTQTLVELVAMVVLVRVVPLLVPDRRSGNARPS